MRLRKQKEKSEEIQYQPKCGLTIDANGSFTKDINIEPISQLSKDYDTPTTTLTPRARQSLVF